MIIENIIGRHDEERTTGKQTETVSFEWFERDKRILKKVSSSGKEIGLRLSEPLFDGAILYEDGNRVIILSLTECEIIRISVSSMREMGRACFELGNRHLPLSIGDDHVETPYESPTLAYLSHLGFDCAKTVGKFLPSVTVRGHSHG
ncbi:MAG: urease accessory protein UreE [Gracilibacteraceae bacterium]|jgi:urease accessory protein|nr:urease accessory protein UreE [Gracilibacteraceae bacterium]